MYTRILVPTDGSDAAIDAARHAVELAAEFDATVHALHVIEDMDAIVPSLTREQDEVKEMTHRFATEVTDEVRDIAAEFGVECVTATEQGVVHERIADYVEAHDIDHVVMGSIGRSGISEHLLGSTAERVLRTVEVPVTVVRHPQAAFE